LIVAAEVQAFFQASDWNKLTAGHKLAPLIQPSWFGQALITKLSFKQVMEEDEAIEIIAAAAPAGKEHRRALKMLIEWLEASGLVQRDGTQLKSVTAPPTNQSRQDAVGESAGESPTPRPKVATAFSQMAQGTMRFNVSFDVDLSEMANWRPDRIEKFFGGIAQVLAAKAEVEKTAKD
jgi:poly-D-alanine transfer protein DltD